MGTYRQDQRNHDQYYGPRRVCKGCGGEAEPYIPYCRDCDREYELGYFEHETD